jgi:hypothetical protein
MAEQEGLFERRQPLETSEGSPGLNEDHRELHPILGSMVGARMIEVEPTPMDTMEGLLELEKVHRAVEFVQAWYSPPELTPLERALGPLNSTRHAVDRINNQFATKIIPCLMNPDKDAALVSFRSIIPNTVDEEMVLLTNDTQFTELHSKLTDHLQSLDGELEAGINANMVEIKRADRMQFSGHTTRSLEKMREKGMEITIDPENIQLIKEAHQLAGGGILPLTEYVKNSKVLGVSGFMGSKVSRLRYMIIWITYGRSIC